MRVLLLELYSARLAAAAKEPKVEHAVAEVEDVGGLELEAFQKRIARAIAGPEREVVISTPRGAGKTSLAALHAVHHLVETEGAAVYCVAASVPQARILYEQAASFAWR